MIHEKQELLDILNDIKSLLKEDGCAFKITCNTISIISNNDTLDKNSILDMINIIKPYKNLFIKGKLLGLQYEIGINITDDFKIEVVLTELKCELKLDNKYHNLRVDSDLLGEINGNYKLDLKECNNKFTYGYKEKDTADFSTYNCNNLLISVLNNNLILHDEHMIMLEKCYYDIGFDTSLSLLLKLHINRLGIYKETESKILLLNKIKEYVNMYTYAPQFTDEIKNNIEKSNKRMHEICKDLMDYIIKEVNKNEKQTT